MIEITILNYLNSVLTNIPVYVEYPEDTSELSKYIIFNKIDNGITNHISSATLMFDCYAKSAYEAALLSEQLKDYMLNSISLDTISSVKLGGYQANNDSSKKRFCYTVILNIFYYD